MIYDNLIRNIHRRADETHRLVKIDKIESEFANAERGVFVAKAHFII